jgi:hypothetical protein
MDAGKKREEVDFNGFGDLPLENSNGCPVLLSRFMRKRAGLLTWKISKSPALRKNCFP